MSHTATVSRSLRTRSPWGTARHYAEKHSWCIVPYYALGPDGICNCSTWHKTQHLYHPANHPRPRTGYRAATNDLQAIDRWSQRWPRSNFAVATGQSRLLGLDPDNRNSGDTLLAELCAELGELPATWTFQSGSGDVRYLFRLPESITLRTGKIIRGSRQPDIIGEGATLMIAGIHHSGKPHVDLAPEAAGAELPLHWIKFLQEELPCNTTNHVLRTRCAVVQGENASYSKDEADADPVSLSCFWKLWELKYQTTDFPTLGQAVLCWMHSEDQHPSGSFYVNLADGRVRFRCYHENKSWALAEVYARTFCGVGPSVGLSKAQLAVFDTRMQLDCGTVSRPTVPYIPPAEDAQELARRLYAGYLRCGV